jgi:hypothetical protein
MYFCNNLRKKKSHTTKLELAFWNLKKHLLGQTEVFKIVFVVSSRCPGHLGFDDPAGLSTHPGVYLNKLSIFEMKDILFF